MDSPALTSPSVPTGGIVVHEGYLFKTPPLDKFFMSWKKRWFVLSLLNPLDPSSLDLSYYCEADRKEKRGNINLHEIKAVNPVHNKSKGNIFSVETEDRKFLLRSADEQGKAVWVAKLLEGCSKEGTTFHVTVPNQPTAAYSEGVLKVSTPLKINIISSLNGSAVMSIPYDRIRRIGCQIALEKDILWVETCSCRDEGENFYFMVVNAGIEKAYQIVLEYKRSIELALRDHMIMEEGNQAKFFYSFVVKSHYGHPEYSQAVRDQIMSNGLLSLSTSGNAISLSDLNRIARSRPSIDVSAVSGVVPGAIEGPPSPYNVRRSPSPRMDSPTSSSPNHHNNGTRMALDQVSRNSRNPGQYSSSAGCDSGVRMDGIDSSRSSAPCYLSNSLNTTSTSWKEQKQRKLTLDDMRKFASLEEPTRLSVNPGRKTSLAQLQHYGGVSSLTRRKDSRGTDSAIGSSSELNGSTHTNGTSKGISLAAYDHLIKKVDNVSVSNKSSYPERKKSSPAYIES